MHEPRRIVISNTTLIIALALVQQLELLGKLYGEVWIPPAVESELEAGGTRAGAAEVRSAACIRSVALDDPRRADLLSDLDRGEAEVIALAQERNADLVIIDERLGRRHSRRLGLNLTGVLGVLIKAKQQGHPEIIHPYVKQMRQGGIRLGDTLVARALEMVRE
jgi:hypothetical protein